MITLRPMTAAEWDAWYAAQRADYAEHLVGMAGLERREAERRAAEGVAALLSGDRATDGHEFLVAEADGRAVARLWLGPPDGGPGGLRGVGLWVYEIRTEPAERRRGHGRAVMLLAEERARERGASWIGLHVYARNAPAIALYESLGYEVTRVHAAGRSMARALARDERRSDDEAQDADGAGGEGESHGASKRE